ncbi:MAG: transcription antitermination factor NusB [Lachnospiraceae bacterium]|nr:transcription antitermination factor NusB [Lachnospiraceae bacterium]
MGRRELREQIFLLLFRVEFNSPEDMPEQIRMFFEDDETYFSEKDETYITEKYGKIIEKKSELDSLLDEKAEGWDVGRMGKIELAVLRLALYEIKYDEDVPASVAINEAVELAKKFGQDNSGSFVNAILAKFV